MSPSGKRNVHLLCETSADKVADHPSYPMPVRFLLGFLTELIAVSLLAVGMFENPLAKRQPLGKRIEVLRLHLILHGANHRSHVNGSLNPFSIVDPKPESIGIRDDRILENSLKCFGKCFDIDHYRPVIFVMVLILPFVDVVEELFICEVREVFRGLRTVMSHPVGLWFPSGRPVVFIGNLFVGFCFQLLKVVYILTKQYG